MILPASPKVMYATYLQFEFGEFGYFKLNDKNAIKARKYNISEIFLKFLTFSGPLNLLNIITIVL